VQQLPQYRPKSIKWPKSKSPVAIYGDTATLLREYDPRAQASSSYLYLYLLHLHIADSCCHSHCHCKSASASASALPWSYPEMQPVCKSLCTASSKGKEAFRSLVERQTCHLRLSNIKNFLKLHAPGRRIDTATSQPVPLSELPASMNSHGRSFQSSSFDNLKVELGPLVRELCPWSTAALPSATCNARMIACR
jgi:hypothetical protein